MNVSRTIKDKEIPRWRPLSRVLRVRTLLASKLSPKRVLVLLAALIVVLLFLCSGYFRRGIHPSVLINDEDVLSSVRTQLRRTIASQWDLKSSKPSILFVTAHTLRNASALTSLACEIALARKMDVLIIYTASNSSGTIPFFLHANRLERCPFVWFDARYEYADTYTQISAVEEIISDAVNYVKTGVVVSVDDEPDWFAHCLDRTTYWRQPAIASIQLKRSALANMRWMVHLSSASLKGIIPRTETNPAWNTPRIDIVITTSQNNTGTLYRLLESLLGAEYILPIVPRLFITFNPNTTTTGILKLLEKWPSDRLILRYQIDPLHSSFPGALQAWYPTNNDNYILALQDDVELSPWYMYWLHLALLKYVYSDTLPSKVSSLSQLTGISLQNAPRGNLPHSLDIRRALLLTPMYSGWTTHSTPYTWQSTLFHSTLFFPVQWRELHQYISLRRHFPQPSLPPPSPYTMESLWGELLLLRGYTLLYPNFDEHVSFAVQHPHENEGVIGWAQFLDQVNPGLPNWEDLPVLDYENRVVGWREVETRAREVREKLGEKCGFREGRHRLWLVSDLVCYEREGEREEGEA
jgi:hypothetical protein